MSSEGKEMAEATLKRISYYIDTSSDIEFCQQIILKSYITLSKAQQIIFVIELEDKIYTLKNSAIEEEQQQKEKWGQIIAKRGEYITVAPLVLWLRNLPNALGKEKKINDNYSMRQIAIACYVMDKFITEENALEILQKYSGLTSTKKFLARKIINSANIIQLTGNKTADTKRKKDLIAAERLVSGEKDKEAIKKIKYYISEYNVNYDGLY